MRARQVAHGAVGVAKALFGFDPADPREVMARRRACLACPRLRKPSLLLPARCADCGCSIKLKSQVQTERCPRGRW